MKPIPQIAAEAHAAFLKELRRAGVPDLLQPCNGDAWEALPLSWQLAFIAAATHTLALGSVNTGPITAYLPPMSGKTKPKRVRRVWDCLNPITVALNASTLFTEAEREKLMLPVREAMAALRQATCTEWQWLQLATCTQVALCIEDQGIVRGLREQLTQADRALCNIDERARTTGAWRAPTCYGHELVTMDTLLTLYAFQITQLAAGEYRRAVTLAKARQLTHGGKIVRAVA